MPGTTVLIAAANKCVCVKHLIRAHCAKAYTTVLLSVAHLALDAVAAQLLRCRWCVAELNDTPLALGHSASRRLDRHALVVGQVPREVKVDAAGVDQRKAAYNPVVDDYLCTAV